MKETGYSVVQQWFLLALALGFIGFACVGLWRVVSWLLGVL